MDWAIVIAALVGAGGPLSIVLTWFERRNSRQHSASLEAQARTLAEVTNVRRDIIRLEGRFDNYTDNHAMLHARGH
jgi:hypothetical protein